MGVMPSLSPQCSSYWRGNLRVTLDYGRQLYLLIYCHLTHMHEQCSITRFLSLQFWAWSLTSTQQPISSNSAFCWFLPKGMQCFLIPEGLTSSWISKLCKSNWLQNMKNESYIRTVSMDLKIEGKSWITCWKGKVKRRILSYRDSP